jgi:hypothetical protein
MKTWDRILPAADNTLSAVAAQHRGSVPSHATRPPPETTMTDPIRSAVNWFEIPVTDLDRAQAFY